MESSEGSNELFGDENEIDEVLSELDDSNDVAFCSANPSTYSSDQLIEMYDEVKAFLAEEYGLTPDLVFEPGNGLDVSSAESFDEAEVLYANKGSDTVEKLEAHESCSVRQDDPREVDLGVVPDLTLFKDTTFDESTVVQNIDSDYVVANNHTGAAKNIDGVQSYSIVAVVSEEDLNVDKLDIGQVPREEFLDDNLYVFEQV